MAWPPDPDEVRKHDEEFFDATEEAPYNTIPPCSCGRCAECRAR